MAPVPPVPLGGLWAGGGVAFVPEPDCGGCWYSVGLLYGFVDVPLLTPLPPLGVVPVLEEVVPPVVVGAA